MPDRYDDRNRFERGFNDRNWERERWERSRSELYGSLDDGRIEYDRSGAAYRGWNEPSYGYRPAYGYGSRDWQQPSRETSHGYYEDPRGRIVSFEHGPNDDMRGGHSGYGGYRSTGDYRSTRTPEYTSHGYNSMGYAGIGPKGYRRTDERITEEVCDRLADDPRIDASEIEVAVKNGEVTLSGVVHSRHEKRAAEDMIEHCSGVRDVHNHLRVEHWSPSESPLGINQASASPTATTKR